MPALLRGQYNRQAVHISLLVESNQVTLALIHQESTAYKLFHTLNVGKGLVACKTSSFQIQQVKISSF
jgi:hypothetical protein